MIVLLLTYCLANGTGCKDHRAEADGLTPQTCMLYGQRIAAEDPFVLLHPEMRVTGWRCVAVAPGRPI